MAEVKVEQTPELMAIHIENLESENAAKDTQIAALLRMDTPWPLSEVLLRLSLAATHLLAEHSCDMHGHEGVRDAAIAASEIIKAIDSAAEAADAFVAKVRSEAFEEAAKIGRDAMCENLSDADIEFQPWLLQLADVVGDAIRAAAKPAKAGRGRDE